MSSIVFETKVTAVFNFGCEQGSRVDYNLERQLTTKRNVQICRADGIFPAQ